MNVLNFPTEKERRLKAMRLDLLAEFSILDEPMKTRAVDDIMMCAEKTLLGETVRIVVEGATVEEQRESMSVGVQALVTDVSLRLGDLLGEIILLRMSKATCEMLHGDR